MQNAQYVHFALLRTSQDSDALVRGRPGHATGAGLVMERGRVGYGAEAGPVTEQRLAWSEKKKLTSQPDMGPRGSPEPLKSHGTGPGLVMERGLV